METEECNLQNVLHDNKREISPIIKKKYTKRTPKIVLADITYETYNTNTFDITKYKIPQLKVFLKTNKLHSSGKKEILIERIETYFKKIKNAIKIQSVYRRWLVIQMFNLRGPANKHRTMCVNSTDFCTLEPVEEIDDDYFYSFTDANNMTYGFNIASLIEYMMSNQNSVTNPYNRDFLDKQTTHNIITLYACCFINIPLFKSNNKPYISRNIHNSRIVTSRNQNQNQNQINIRGHQLINEIIYNPRINRITSEEDLARFYNIQSIRRNTNQERIDLLFTTIDRLGNYANSAWFSELDIRNYVRLYRAFYDIWNIRSGLSREIRHSISPFCNPFDGIFNQRVYLSDLSLSQMQNACLIVFENVIYSSADEEYQKLGAFHALSALTLVSRSARETMPWLYESVMY